MFDATQAKIAGSGAGHWGPNLIRNFNELNALELICDSDETKEPYFIRTASTWSTA